MKIEEVLSIIKSIPYGKTITYGDIAKIIIDKRGIKKMSSQAVGQAVKSNPICLIVPCHRVIGINNKMVGYVGGINNKIKVIKRIAFGYRNFYHWVTCHAKHVSSTSKVIKSCIFMIQN